MSFFRLVTLGICELDENQPVIDGKKGFFQRCVPAVHPRAPPKRPEEGALFLSDLLRVESGRIFDFAEVASILFAHVSDRQYFRRGPSTMASRQTRSSRSTRAATLRIGGRSVNITPEPQLGHPLPAALLVAECASGPLRPRRARQIALVAPRPRRRRRTTTHRIQTKPRRPQ